MRYSFALFGHYKPNWSMIEIEYDTLVATFVDEPKWDAGQKAWIDGKIVFPEHVYRLHQWIGNERRAVPGDVIACKEAPAFWTATERKEFLIIEIDNLTFIQANALCEMEWDLNSYNLYDPLSEENWYARQVEKTLLTNDPPSSLKKLDEKRIEWFENYMFGEKFKNRFPKTHWKKRRFNIPLTTLESKGVDIEQMLDRKVLYNPTIESNKLEYYDKLKQRNILETDKLKTIKPRTDEEMENPPSLEETLGRIRS